MKLQNLCKETQVDCRNCWLYTPAACSTVPCSAPNDDYKVELLKLHHFVLLVIIFHTECHSNICSLQLIRSSEKFSCLENNLSTYLRETACIYVLTLELLQHRFLHLDVGGRLVYRLKAEERNSSENEHSDAGWWYQCNFFLYVTSLCVQLVGLTLENLF